MKLFVKDYLLNKWVASLSAQASDMSGCPASLDGLTPVSESTAYMAMSPIDQPIYELAFNFTDNSVLRPSDHFVSVLIAVGHKWSRSRVRDV